MNPASLIYSGLVLNTTLCHQYFQKIFRLDQLKVARQYQPFQSETQIFTTPYCFTPYQIQSLIERCRHLAQQFLTSPFTKQCHIQKETKHPKFHSWKLHNYCSASTHSYFCQPYWQVHVSKIQSQKVQFYAVQRTLGIVKNIFFYCINRTP